MKRILNILILLSASGFSYAQTTALSASENYIYTRNCLSEDCSKKTETVEYFDDLGRTKQTVYVKASPSGKDLVIPVEYDGFGRTTKSYLPIPQQGTQNGMIYTAPLGNAAQAYGTDSYFYASVTLENSPFNRMLSQKKPGQDFQGYETVYEEEVNGASDVKKYVLTTSWLYNTTREAVTLSGNYPAGVLLKNTVTNEDGRKVTEFRNGKGQTVLVRRENADTYYLYNAYGQLAYVIPPLAAAGPLNQDMLDKFCYQYRYDAKGRQAEKKLPGKGWEYTVFDKHDRILMTQDANTGKSRQWIFIKYDRLGRAVYTGIYISSYAYGSEGRNAEQAAAGSAAVQNESRDAGGFNAGGVTAYYTNSAYPSSFAKILTVNYYDTYPSDSPARASQVLSAAIIGDNMADAVNTRNLSTASYVKNIEDDNWTKSYLWYDARARAVGTYSINHLGGYTKTETSLDFAGVPQLSKVYHKRLGTDTEKTITQTFEYDSGNRLKKQWHQVDSQPQELLSENTYNDLSQLILKKTGNSQQEINYAYNIRGGMTAVNDPDNLGNDLFAYAVSYYQPSGTAAGKYSGNIESVRWKSAQDNILRKYTYEYDALNRLTKGLYAEPGSTVPGNNFYNESAAYDPGGNLLSLQRNAKSVSATAEMIDNLVYTYTGNRLASVKDNSQNYAGYPDVSGNPISYDDNGNMTDHTDKGILEIKYNLLNQPDFVKFDKTYVPRTNLGGDYHVNTQYLYRADGSKLRKTYTFGFGPTNTQTATQTDYLDGFQYEATSRTGKFSMVLKFVPTAEGYYDFEKNKYIYSYTDHLGNVRLSYFKKDSGSAEVLEENNFYPFGLKHEGYNAQAGNPSYNYQYNSKELQKETGWSDYGARMYMSDIGRWGVVDPLAESTTRVSPYNYALNNPVMFIDPDGRKAMASTEMDENSAGFGNGRGMLSYLGRGDSQSILSFLGRDDEFMKSRVDGLGGGGGSGPTPKSSTGPGIIERIGNFFSNLFSSKGAGIKTYLPGAAVTRASLQVGTAEGVFETALTLEEAMAAAGVLSRGLWGLPLMLNGDSQFAPNSKPITMPLDVPVTTTDVEPEQKITLYRGVHAQHPDLSNAYLGMANPWGGSATAYQHNMGDNNSMFTSWSRSIDVANWCASRRGYGGVILKQSFPLWRLTNFNNYPGEQEMQVFGPVYGAQVIKPWGKPGTWTPYLK